MRLRISVCLLNSSRSEKFRSGGGVYLASGAPSERPEKILSQNDETRSDRASNVSSSQPNSLAARYRTSRSTYFSPSRLAIIWPMNDPPAPICREIVMVVRIMMRVAWIQSLFLKPKSFARGKSSQTLVHPVNNDVTAVQHECAGRWPHPESRCERLKRGFHSRAGNRSRSVLRR